MAKFLNTIDVINTIDSLIKSSEKELFLVSSDFTLDEKLKDYLSLKNILSQFVHIVFRENELLGIEDIKWLTHECGYKTFRASHLYTNTYLNENFCILTSMSLNCFINNYNELIVKTAREWTLLEKNFSGILISRVTENELYQSVYDDVQRVIYTTTHDYWLDVMEKNGVSRNEWLYY